MLNVPPGAIVPEFQAPLLATELCATESLFIHVTVAPTATVTGLGEYALVVNVDEPDTMETGVLDVLGEVVDGDDELQAVETVNARMASGMRIVMKTSCTGRPQIRCPILDTRFVRHY
jgi:hypothetical protein